MDIEMFIVLLRLSIKKSVSCPAGGRNCCQLGGRNYFFSIFLSFFGRKILSIFGEKNPFFCKKEKKVPSRPFFRHPAAPPETEFFFRLA